MLALAYLLLSLLGVTALLLNVFDETELRTQLNLMFLLLIVSNSLVLFCLYILGAYLGRTYFEVKGRPSFIVYEDLIVREPRQVEGPRDGEPDELHE